MDTLNRLAIYNRIYLLHHYYSHNKQTTQITKTKSNLAETLERESPTKGEEEGSHLEEEEEEETSLTMALVYVAVARVRGPIQFEQATAQGNHIE